MIINANALFQPFANNTFHCTVTSPPYYMLRNYGVIGQIGNERTPDEYIYNLVQVFKEVYRVSRPDSTLWLNIADSYAGSAAETASKIYKTSKTKLLREWGYDDKEELDIPYRLKQALRSIGWKGRCTVIWNKPNPMPESVTDRPTKSHEYLFLLAKRERYYYDAEAIREDSTNQEETFNRYELGKFASVNGSNHKTPDYRNMVAGRNRRSVWTIPTAPYKGAHFATFPPALVEPCIKAGTSERGVCPKCGKGWKRIVKKEFTAVSDGRKNITGQDNMNGWEGVPRGTNEVETLGWQPSCTCGQDNGGPLEPIPAIVFDPFVGSGTTVKVAYDLGRRGVGLDLSLEYLSEQATTRIHNGHTGRLL